MIEELDWKPSGFDEDVVVNLLRSFTKQNKLKFKRMIHQIGDDIDVREQLGQLCAELVANVAYDEAKRLKVAKVTSEKKRDILKKMMGNVKRLHPRVLFILRTLVKVNRNEKYLYEVARFVHLLSTLPKKSWHPEAKKLVHDYADNVAKQVTIRRNTSRRRKSSRRRRRRKSSH